MSAVLLKGHGGFEQLEHRVDVPVPTPGPAEVLIRVGAAGVNNTDINTRIGWYSNSVTAVDDAGWTGARPTFPRIQGADACGTIVGVGAGVAPARIGERVLVEPVFRIPGVPERHRVLYFGSECDGAFAQYTAVPAAHAHLVSSSLTDAELASFPCAYGAAENMLSRLNLLAGETVLITGASGGVGSAAVQLARRRGATVLAVVGGAKADAVLGLGASRVFERGVRLNEAVGMEQVDAIVDCVGGGQFPDLLDILRRGGRYAVAGAIGGATVSLDLRTLYLKDLQLLGCTVLDDRVFPDLIGYIERHEIKPVIANIRPLDEIVEAQQEFLLKRHTGKIVLIP